MWIQPMCHIALNVFNKSSLYIVGCTNSCGCIHWGHECKKTSEVIFCNNMHSEADINMFSFYHYSSWFFWTICFFYFSAAVHKNVTTGCGHTIAIKVTKWEWINKSIENNTVLFYLNKSSNWKKNKHWTSHSKVYLVVFNFHCPSVQCAIFSMAGDYYVM